jgi:hypothetical protein
MELEIVKYGRALFLRPLITVALLVAALVLAGAGPVSAHELLYPAWTENPIHVGPSTCTIGGGAYTAGESPLYSDAVGYTGGYNGCTQWGARTKAVTRSSHDGAGSHYYLVTSWKYSSSTDVYAVQNNTYGTPCFCGYTVSYTYHRSFVGSSYKTSLRVN